MPDGDNRAWWHAPLIGALMAVGTTVTGFIGTHWGGVTSDELAKTEKRILTKLTETMNASDLARAKDVDDLRRYIDAKTVPAAPKKKRKQRSDDE